MSNNLTPQELRILELVRDGLSNKEIGPVLSIAEQTVKNHITNIFATLDCTSRTAAVIAAIRQGQLGLYNER